MRMSLRRRMRIRISMGIRMMLRMMMMRMRMRMMTEVNWISGKNKDTQKISFSWQKNMVLPIKYKNRVPIFWLESHADGGSFVAGAPCCRLWRCGFHVVGEAMPCDSDVFFLEVFGPSP
jgi:hypothetical protein